ncbi:hypothetical protein H7849_11005 [Alloacidobacterium dinghuense]|uniref:Uncharacterized protein n=1 Tax=Alloacidobacterium dinghuense TaxID=2763107 RepID=A0A7G8BPA0_9BACT|nr:hypothetical protein [Alloacidobacterium dinghuense]QNI34370.1 hypothetical protein H7849_11005 [Alloacidobacterium dinghuense]
MQIDMAESLESIDSKQNNGSKEPRPSRLKTGLLVIGSALLGGIAVALWNRRSLADIRNQPEDSAPKLPLPEDDAIY